MGHNRRQQLASAKRKRATETWMILAAIVFVPAAARADGGVVRFSEQRGPWTITVFTSPTPPRVGLIDVSVLVQNTSTGQPVLDAPVAITGPGGVKTIAGEHGTNKLLLSAAIDVQHAGPCSIAVDVGEETIRFAIDVAEPLPGWWTMGPWIAWPAAVIVLFVVLVAQSRRGERASAEEMKNRGRRTENRE